MNKYCDEIQEFPLQLTQSIVSSTTATTIQIRKLLFTLITHLAAAWDDTAEKS